MSSLAFRPPDEPPPCPESRALSLPSGERPLLPVLAVVGDSQEERGQFGKSGDGTSYADPGNVGLSLA